MNNTQKNLIYLLSCAVNEITPDAARVRNMNLDRLYKWANSPSVRGAVCIALKRAGVQDTLDWNYIVKQTKQLEIADFEQERRTLAIKVFSSDTLPDLTESEQELLMYYLTSETYGTFDNRMKKKLKDQTKAGYILSQMFPPMSHMKWSVKFVGKCPVLYPVGIVYRWGRILLIRRDILKKTIKAVKKYAK